VVKSGGESRGHEALPHARNRPQAEPPNRDEHRIGMRLARPLVRVEQKAGMGQFPCS
jgi:hypothetical protein